MAYGGFGQAAFGRHQYGSEASVIEPRFNASFPTDGQQNTPLDVWLEYEIYYFSSFPNPDDPAVTALSYPVEISEDGGSTWMYGNVAPYTTTIRHKDGQTVWIKVVKDSDWTDNQEIVVRTTYPDEFGQSITKTLPVRWP